MPFVSKRMKKASMGIDRNKEYALPEAVKMLKDRPGPKFDETVEVSIKLGVDPKKADQLIRGAISLPKGLGKSKSVVVFADGQMAEKAKAAGALEVGTEDLAKKIDGGWLDFDVVVATPAMMRIVGKLGRVLGPQGKMPSPKSGTVTDDVETAVREFAAGKVEFRVDEGGNVHVPVGKKSFNGNDLEANISHLIDFIRQARPASVKGIYMEKVTISSTMGPGIRVAVAKE